MKLETLKQLTKTHDAPPSKGNKLQFEQSVTDLSQHGYGVNEVNEANEVNP